MELVLDNVCVDYDGYRAIDGVSLALGAGEVLGLLGPNGSGKSTLIKAVAGVLRPAAGSVRIDGRDVVGMGLNEAARQIGYVPQSAPVAYHSTVTEAVLLGRKPYIRWGVSRDDLVIVERSLRAMDIEALAGKPVGQLSGGEQQKVAIARALAQEPRVFLFDEPTNNLDLKHQIEVLELARALASSRGTSTLVALHDLNLALAYCDRVVLLAGGRVRACGRPADVLTPGNIREVYGVEVTVHDWEQGRFIVPCRARAPAAGEGGGA